MRKKICPKSSGRQDRMPCHAALDLLGGLLQHICPHAGKRRVDVQAIQRMVRRRQQVDGGMPDQQGDVRMSLERAHQRCTNRFAGGIRGVDDPGQGMPAFEGQG